MELIFPSSFLWGASISSYQTEGNNFNSDWFIWEKEKKLEPAGKATNHYSLFKEDFLLANKLNLNCLRFSIEWARLSISQNNFLEEGLNHYEDVILTLKKK